MRQDRIVTSLHRLRERLTLDAEIYLDPLEENPDIVLAHLALIHDDDVPLYYLSDEVMALAESQAARDSIGALIATGMTTQLPFPYIIIEYEPTSRWRPNQSSVFTMLIQRAKPQPIALSGKNLNLNAKVPALPENLTLSFSALVVVLFNDHTRISSMFGIDATGPIGPNLLTFSLHDPGSGPGSKTREVADRAAITMIKLAVKTLLLAMSTDGVGKEKLPAPERLNAARKRKGKPPIPSCTVLHVSHYRDRQGQQHAATGRHVRLHLRAGHIRNQPCGPGSLERKKIFISPVIVNYRPDEPDTPTPPRVLREIRP